jgi:hypothetical protein
MKMHQLDATIDSQWNLLVASKPKGCIIDATQWFIVEASLLAKKWQDKIGSFHEVSKRALELVPELSLSFEEVDKEKVQVEEESKEKKEDNVKKHALLEVAKETSTLLEGESRHVVGAYWALHFWVEYCARRTTVPILVKTRVSQDT